MADLKINEQGQIIKDGIVQDNIQPEIKDSEQESIKAEQVQQAKVYEQPQPEKIRPREKSIKDEVEDELRKTEQHTQKQDNPSVDLWMNRFNGWYSAIDRVSQSVKDKFVKMKSDIIKTIGEKLKERTNYKQVSKQEQNTNER